MLGPCCGTWALHCGLCAQLPQGMWDLSSPTRDQTHISCIGRRIPNHWTTRKFSEFLCNWETFLFHQLFYILYRWKVKGRHKPIGQGQVSLWNEEKRISEALFLEESSGWDISLKWGDVSPLIKKMLFNLILLFCMTQAWCDCQSDSSEQSALVRQPFVSQLGHYTPELFLTFLWFSRLDGIAVIKVTLNRVELLQRTVCPWLGWYHAFSLCLQWGTSSWHMKIPLEKKKKIAPGRRIVPPFLSWLLLSVFLSPRSNWNPPWYKSNMFSLVLSSGKVRRLSGQCPLKIFFQRLIISNSGCCFQILGEAWFALPVTWSSLVLQWGLWDPAGAVGGLVATRVKRQSWNQMEQGRKWPAHSESS